MNAELEAQVQRWIAEDPDPVTRAELQKLLDDDNEGELQERFAGMLQFGTAGLRGLLGGGPGRMNRAVVQRATAGLCRYLLEQVPDAKERGVVIGYDARRMSHEFALDVAAVVSGHGLRALLFDERVPTPIAGFAVLDQNAAAGVVITASHNPPDYNGYKVFWGNGAQIIPPHDGAIAAHIAAIDTLASIPKEPSRHVTLGEDVRARYLDGVQGVVRHAGVERDLSIVYTAMHGVGGKFVEETLNRAGFTKVVSVAEQAEPDGTFPTVAFPNPEEDGAMDLALACAREHDAALVLANDPDADRLAVIVRDDQGAYRPLTGNEIGCLLAHRILEETSGDDRLVICSIVSSPMLLSIGEVHGVRAEQTLTGHKWIQNRALELAQEGLRYVFGYEEALGYGIGTLVRDKDGISAALAIADIAAWCASEGRTIAGELERMARKYGLYLSDQVSLVRPGPEGRAEIEARMKASRDTPPTSLGGCAVLATCDFETGKRVAQDGSESALTLPSSDMLLFELEGGHRAMMRPSGTEPKVKHYIDVRVDLAEGESLEAGRARGDALLTKIRNDFTR